MHHEAQVLVVQFSPDGAWLATGSYDQTVRLWNGLTGAALGRPLEHAGIVRSIEFGPEGRRLLTAAEDRTVRIWDIRSGRLVMEPIRHAAEVWSARFSPDGQRVVTASSDRICGIWDVRPGAARPRELPARVLVRGLCWSPDGQGIVAKSMPPRWFGESGGAAGLVVWHHLDERASRGGRRDHRSGIDREAMCAVYCGDHGRLGPGLDSRSFFARGWGTLEGWVDVVAAAGVNV